jgi:hypothetical protein
MTKFMFPLHIMHMEKQALSTVIYVHVLYIDITYYILCTCVYEERVSL